MMKRKEDKLTAAETPATPAREPAPDQSAPRPAAGVAMSGRKPQITPEVMRSAPTGYRELSIPAADRGPFTDQTKTLLFKLTYNGRPAVIAVTANERGQLVNAYVGGALATVVSERVLLAKKKQRSAVGGPARNDPMREPEGGDSTAIKTLGENLADMECAGSAVAKSILETLGFPW